MTQTVSIYQVNAPTTQIAPEVTMVATPDLPKLTAKQLQALVAAKVETYEICDYNDEGDQQPRATRTGYLVRGNEHSLYPLVRLGLAGRGVVIKNRGEKAGRELTAEGIRVALQLQG